MKGLVEEVQKGDKLDEFEGNWVSVEEQGEVLGDAIKVEQDGEKGGR